jgi:hypothetical protein
MPQNFSPIQNYILSKLKNAESMRYTDLRPRGIPNDLFNYHLQFLVQKKFVQRDTQGYALDDAGVKHVADPDVSLGEEKIASLFKVNVITLVSRVHDGQLQILDLVRHSHPSFGKIGAMGGIVQKGESIEAAATRKLRTETGLEANFKIMGIERRMMYDGGKLFSDILFPIGYADHFTGELIDTEFGHNFWVSIEEAIQHESSDFDSIKAICTVLTSIRDHSIGTLPFFYNEETQAK